MISSKNISFNIFFINKNLIFYRLNNSVLNNRYKNIDNFYFAHKGLYIRFNQDYINYVAKFSIWNFYGISFFELY